MRKTRLHPISKKRQAQLPIYNNLIKKLRELCNNKSELSGESPNWESNYQVEPHHVEKRNGKRLLDPYGIILLTRYEHDVEEGKIRREKPTDKENLLAIVKDIRIKQGFIPND